MSSLRLALAQVNTIAGGLDHNVSIVKKQLNRAIQSGADLVIFPELTVTGYPVEDLLLDNEFIAANRAALDSLLPHTSGIAAVLGFVDKQQDRLYNAAAVCVDGELAFVYHKHHLPNEGVFDEKRYFTAGKNNFVLDSGKCALGVSICEDFWRSRCPADIQAQRGAQLLVNISASPYCIGKYAERLDLVTEIARTNKAYVALVNQIGGQDELVFDGGSMLVSPSGEELLVLPQFEEKLGLVDIDLGEVKPVKQVEEVATEVCVVNNPLPAIETPRREIPHTSPVKLSQTEECYAALVLATRDFVGKCGYESVFIGVSGGIDSALVATIAVDALGPSKVTGVAMPGQFSSELSMELAEQLCEKLHIPLLKAPIEQSHRALTELIESVSGGALRNTTDENIQARLRGLLLMAFANMEHSAIVLTTGNKSEMATGYATLYGDMAGHYAVLKDVSKGLVYELADWRNQSKRDPASPIPQAIIDRPPTAELRPGQLDSDSLPPYSTVDALINATIEQRNEYGPAENPAVFDEGTLKKFSTMLIKSEYKRQQAPLGPKITRLAFGKDRRMPLAARRRVEK